MIKSGTIAQLEALRNYLSNEDSYEAQDDDIAALNTVIEAISTLSEGKLYTALDVIRIVQAAVSDAVCGMGAEESAVTAYEIERGIVAELVKGGAK